MTARAIPSRLEVLTLADGRELPTRTRLQYQPRPVSRDRIGAPHIVLAEWALWHASLHASMCRDDPGSRWCDGVRWDLDLSAELLAAVDGPRSVRTRAQRLARRLKRVTSRLAGGAR